MNMKALRRLGAVACLAAIPAFAIAQAPLHPIPRDAKPPPSDAPPPETHLPPAGLHQNTLPAPVHLAATTQEPVCTAHGGFGAGLACKAVFPAGQLVLIWDWPGKAPPSGYRIYEVSGGHRSLVGAQTQTDSPGAAPYTIFIFQSVPAAGYAGTCYTVAAYDSEVASVDSAPFCVGGGSVVQTATLSPSHERSISVTRGGTTNGGATNTTGEVSDNSTSIINLGSQSNSMPTVGFSPGDEQSISVLARTGVAFDLTPVMYKTIKSARLAMSVNTTIGNMAEDPSLGDVSDHYTSCITQIGIGRDTWWSYQDWIDVAVVQPQAQEQGPEVSFDVTAIVAKWASGQTNYGFVLMGPGDTPDASANNFTPAGDCLTVYRGDDIQLIVEYN